MILKVAIFTDGFEPVGLQEIILGWQSTWEQTYTSEAQLIFLPQRNLKQAELRRTLPPVLEYVERIRNPDVYFVEETQGVELGGVEITDHSPDGSNIEKRYPFLW